MGGIPTGPCRALSGNYMFFSDLGEGSTGFYGPRHTPVEALSKPVGVWCTPDRPRQAPTGPDRPRQGPTGPDTARQAPTGPSDRALRQAPTGPDRGSPTGGLRQAPTGPDRALRQGSPTGSDRGPTGRSDREPPTEFGFPFVWDIV